MSWKGIKSNIRSTNHLLNLDNIMNELEAAYQVFKNAALTEQLLHASNRAFILMIMQAAFDESFILKGAMTMQLPSKSSPQILWKW